MIITGDTCHFPLPILFLPDMKEFKSATILFAIFIMTKTMKPGLNSSIIFYGITFHATRDQVSSQTACFISFKQIAKIYFGLLKICDPTFVMIKFKRTVKC